MKANSVASAFLGGLFLRIYIYHAVTLKFPQVCHCAHGDLFLLVFNKVIYSIVVI